METQIGQLAIALTGRTPGNLPSNTKINPKEQAKAITMRSGVQLPEIHVKRPGVIGETSSSTEEETVVKESSSKENSEESQDKAKVTEPLRASDSFSTTLEEAKNGATIQKISRNLQKAPISTFH